MKTFLTLCSLLGLLALASRGAEEIVPVSAEPGVNAGRIIQTVRPQFPLVLMRNAVRQGQVLLLLEVAPSGQLADVLVTAYTREEFADEVRRVLPLWRYEPARVAGQPVATIMALSVRFELEGVLITAPQVSDTAEARARHEKFSYEAKNLRQIDRIPTPVKVVAPAYPPEWARRGLSGKIDVNFYIDESGRVRMASCPPGTDDRLAGLALSAVKEWQFTPPSADGRPVLVSARQVFNFVEGAPASDGKG